MQATPIDNQAVQGVTDTSSTQSTTPTTSTATAPLDDFETYLQGLLSPDAENNVSEEELFSGVISERLKTEKGDDLADKYNSLLQTKKTEMTKSDGYIPYEDAAKAALRQMRDEGDLSKDDADKIYSESFQAS